MSASSSSKRKHSIQELRHDFAKKRLATHVITPSSTINEWPDELLLLIINEAFNWKSTSEKWSFLRNVSLVNRHFHRIVTEKLYETIHVGLGDDPYLLLRTIMGNKKLAKSVQRISFSLECLVPGLNQPGYQKTDQDKNSIYDGMHLTGMHDWEAWAQDCNHPQAHKDTLLSVLLMHTKNVREISVRIGRDFKLRERSITQWLDMFRRAKQVLPRDQMHTFDHLRCIRLKADFSIRINELMPIFHLDTLVELEFDSLFVQSGSSLISGPSSVLRRELSAGCNNIETFTFIQGFVHADVLNALLATSRNLKYLHIEFGGLNSPRNTHLMNSNTTLSTILERHAASLEGLYVHSSQLLSDHNSWGSWCSWCCLYPNLENFTSLKHLATMGYAAFQGETDDFVLRPMPPSLEDLLIICRTPIWIDVHLEQLALYHSFWAPSLRRFNLMDGENMLWTLSENFSESAIDVYDHGWKLGDTKWWRSVRKRDAPTLAADPQRDYLAKEEQYKEQLKIFEVRSNEQSEGMEDVSNGELDTDLFADPLGEAQEE